MNVKPDPADVPAMFDFISDQLMRLSVVVADWDARTLPRTPQLQCAACLQQAADAEALGKTPDPILPAATVVQGMAICNERHRIVSQASAAGSLLIPPSGHLPPMNGFGQRAA